MTAAGPHAAGAWRLAAVQLAPVLGDPYGNRRWALRAADDALRLGADLVVLPELATSGAVFERRDEVEEAAIGCDHPYFGQLADLLLGTDRVLVIGFAEAASGVLFDSAAVVGAAGVLAVHRKTLLWDPAQRWFAPGSRPAPIVDLGWCRLGVLIGDEFEFSATTDALARDGADVVAVPANRPGAGLSPRAGALLAPGGTAVAGGPAVVRADRAGRERGRVWAEDSVVLDRSGRAVAAAPGGNAVRTAEELAADDERPPLVIADVDLRAGRRVPLDAGQSARSPKPSGSRVNR